MKHDLWSDADNNPPSVICDRNGSVVLACCKVCGLGECELDETPECPGERVNRAARMAEAEFDREYPR